MAIKSKFLSGSDADVTLLEAKDLAGKLLDYSAANTAVCNRGQYVEKFWTVTVPANFVVTGEYLERVGSNYYEPQFSLNNGNGTTSRQYACFCPSYATPTTTDAGVSAGSYKVHVIGYVNT